MSTDPYQSSFVVGWGDLDPNGHMKNTAYLDVCVDVRFGYFATHGLTRPEFEKLRIGAVVRRDEIDYHRELRFLDPYTVDIELAGLSEDASRMMIRNRFYRADGRLAAVVRSTGGWMDLAQRRLIAPPDVVREALRSLQRADDFEELPSSVR
jgi:acyl-CoA thioester hydrolase